MKLSFIVIALLATYLNAAKPFIGSETTEKSEVEENIVRLGYYDDTIAMLSNEVRQSHNSIEEIEKIGFDIPEIFKTIFDQNKDILPPTAARDILIQAMKKGHSPLVTLLLESKEFDLVMDHEIVLLAFKSFILDESRPISKYFGPHRYTTINDCASYDIFKYIIEQALLRGVDLSINENILLAKAISYDFTPLIETLTMDPKVKAVGLTKKVQYSIRDGSFGMSFGAAKSIVRAFGVGPIEINEFFWNRHLFKSTFTHSSMIFEALGLPVPSNEEKGDDECWQFSHDEEDIDSDFDDSDE